MIYENIYTRLINIRHIIGCFSIFLCLVCHAQEDFPYDISNPDKIIKLPKKVNEISGIAYTNGFVYAIDDEHGDLFRIPLEDNPKVQEWSFEKDDDYEDVVLANGIIYVLNSNGNIVWFPEKFPITKSKKAKIDIEGKREFESLYYDPLINRIVMLCKHCSFDKKKNNSAWVLDTANNAFNKQPVYTINRKDIEIKAGKKIGRFKPSAATIDPVTGELYIISSINKVIIIVKNEIVKAVIPINRKLFKQPEGICFTPKGKLIISNEAGRRKPATILIFNKK